MKLLTYFAITAGITFASPTLAQDAQSELARQIEAIANMNTAAEAEAVALRREAEFNERFGIEHPETKATFFWSSIAIDECAVKTTTTMGIENEREDYIPPIITVEFSLEDDPIFERYFDTNTNTNDSVLFTLPEYAPAVETVYLSDFSSSVTKTEFFYGFQFIENDEPDQFISILNQYKEMYCLANS
ncbi:hypothetical protein [Ketogulonicigenium vulgare]|uniref:hypothetical protein n=1 Tax=Ketogulonicigenium vulgare TaxID=92945 RepID=UPI00235920BC|nr:hypothetical protein [Ketogulonicigenium vulgare]